MALTTSRSTDNDMIALVSPAINAKAAPGGSVDY
jgi:hypothetical protein